MVSEEEIKESLGFGRELSNIGYDDVLVIHHEYAREILTEKRLEIIKELKEARPESIRGLAKQLDRGKKQVFNDLKILFKNDIVAFDTEKGAKIPYLKHKHIVITPIHTEDINLHRDTDE